MTATVITIETMVNAPVEQVWNVWTDPKHIIKWNCPSPDWHTPKATHELKPGGKFVFRMEARDGSMGFDYSGAYNEVKPMQLLTSTLDDDRKVKVVFTKEGNATRVVQSFDAENENPVEMQRAGWQGILDNFKNYVEINKDR